jgi:HPr Serine kinase C-terminal domain
VTEAKSECPGPGYGSAGNLVTTEDGWIMTAKSALQSSFAETHGYPRDPLKYYVEFPLHAVHYPLGFPLEISTNSEAVIVAAQESWGPFPKLQSAKKIHLRIGVSESGQKELPKAPIFRAQRGLITIIADAENFAVCDVPRGFGFSWVTPVTVADSAFYRYHFLDVMAGLLLAPVHFAIIHAACVALDGHGVLLCGNSGAGKSTLAFACAQRGWTFISDDAGHALRRHTGRTVIGNPLYLRLRADASDFFPELLERPIILRQNGEMGLEIPTSSLPGFATAFRCAVDHVVFLNRSAAGGARLTRFPKIEAQRWLEDVLDLTLAYKPPWDGMAEEPEMILADQEAREEQRASIRELLTADVHELRYSSLDSAIECLESEVRGRYGNR